MSGYQWTARRRDGGKTPKSEEHGETRLLVLQRAGVVAAYGPGTTFPLYGRNGGRVGEYTFDHEVVLPDGRVIAVEWKGRESRDFRLRAALWRDNYCAGSAPDAPYARLDVVPVLERRECEYLSLKYYDLIDNYDPTTWPTVWQHTEVALRRAAARKGARTKRLNELLRESSST